MSEKLEQAKSEYLLKLRQVKLIEAGVNINDVEKYSRFINAEDEAEIIQQVQEVAADIKQEDSFGDVYQDKRSWKPF